MANYLCADQLLLLYMQGQAKGWCDQCMCSSVDINIDYSTDS